jgi:hypothetical protein
MGGSQSVSLSATYEIVLTPSLFKYDHVEDNDTPIDIGDEHSEKIASHVVSSAFKSDIEKITNIVVRPDTDGADVVHLSFKHSSIKYSHSNCSVIITGKWVSSVKQTKKSVKKSKHGGGNARRGNTMLVDDESAEQDGGGANNEKIIDGVSISDVIDKIKANMHGEAYLESEISKQTHTFICFTENVDVSKV